MARCTVTAPRIDLAKLRAAVAERTEGTWNVEEIPGEACSVVSGDILVGVAYTGDGPRGLVAYAMSGAQQDANARAIVAAINSIDALVELAEAVKAYERAREGLDTVMREASGMSAWQAQQAMLAARSALLTLAARFTKGEAK